MKLSNKIKLSLMQLRKVYVKHEKIHINKSMLNEVNKSHRLLQELIANHKSIYGINTGIGKFADTIISSKDLVTFQRNILLSHAAGTGPWLNNAVIRLIMILKIYSLGLGYSGVSLELLEKLSQLYNSECYPCIPAKGSVGASGDLAPLAHMSLPLIGEGYLRHRGNVQASNAILKKLSIDTLGLKPKEALALTNGTQVSTALALAGFFELENCFCALLASFCLSFIALNGDNQAFHPELQRLKNSLGQQKIAKLLRANLKGCQFEKSHRTQDPYTLRCAPQILGACLDQIAHVSNILHQEANSVSDNPIILNKQKKILKGGNFHAEPIAFASDILAIVAAELGNFSERRITFLTDNHMSGLPNFLAKKPGLNTGFMLAQVTAAALASENKNLATPASTDTIPTSANQEDHVSMATFASRRLQDIADNLAGIIAIELMCACQALDFNKPKKLSTPLQKTYNIIRSQINFYQDDHPLSQDIATIKELIHSGTFNYIFNKTLPSLS